MQWMVLQLHDMHAQVLNMKPQEVLGMLEEAAGTRMYETKKDAALRTLDKKQVKVDEIDKVSLLPWRQFCAMNYTPVWSDPDQLHSRLRGKANVSLTTAAGAERGHPAGAGEAAAGEGPVLPLADRHSRPGCPSPLLHRLQVCGGPEVSH